MEDRWVQGSPLALRRLPTSRTCRWVGQKLAGQWVVLLLLLLDLVAARRNGRLLLFGGRTASNHYG